MKQIGLGFLQYVQDYDGRFPLGSSGAKKNNPSPGDIGWGKMLQPYLKSDQIFKCPSIPRVTSGGITATISYGYNENIGNDDRARYAGDHIASINHSSLVVVNYEADPWHFWSQAFGPTSNSWTSGGFPDLDRHLESANYSFVDGHVKWYKPGKVLGNVQPTNNEPTFFVF